jgi:hypothetical protein
MDFNAACAALKAIAGSPRERRSGIIFAPGFCECRRKYSRVGGVLCVASIGKYPGAIDGKCGKGK